MSYIGTTKIGGMYLGGTEIAKAYLGTDLVFQKGAQPQPVEYTFTAQLSSYIPKATDGSWYSINNSANAYTDENSSTYCQIALTRGSEAETWIYWLFDTSALPANANIVSVECKCKVYSQSTNANQVASRRAQLFSGTTAKGADTLIPQPAAIKTLSGATWTRAELNDVRLRMYGKRGTSNTTTSYMFRLYGATLTIRYTL